jgi:SAM-dependent methyltransferase
MVGRRAYDLMYRLWTPWDAVGVRPELRRLADDGELTATDHRRVIDLGCGTGANAVFLAARGHQVVGVDFAPVALRKAEARARAAGVEDRCRFLEADLTASDLPDQVGGPFDLIVDASSLDDLDADGRAILAGHLARLARPGAVMLCWCWYTARNELPRISFTGPSRLSPGIDPGEEHRLFGDAFDIEVLRPPHRHEACLLLRRRADVAGHA